MIRVPPTQIFANFMFIYRLLIITLRVTNSRDLASNLARMFVNLSLLNSSIKNANTLFARYNPYLDEL